MKITNALEESLMKTEYPQSLTEKIIVLNTLFKVGG